MHVLINYADRYYRKAQYWNTFSGRHIGKFDKIYSFSPDDIDEKFRSENKQILDCKRGNGLWLWKPYFIDKVIKTCADGDIVFYCDSGAVFLREPRAIYNALSEENSIYCSDISLLESCFTKPLCFDKMNCNSSFFKNSNQIIATYFVIYVCDKTRNFITEWLQYCKDFDLISPLGVNISNLKEDMGSNFVTHREDQSIFSLLCKREGIKPHKDFSQRSPKSYYSPFYAYKVPIHAETDNAKPILWLHKSAKLNLAYFIMYFARKIKNIFK